MSKSAALVLFSGGQDSATVLAWALKNYERVETIGFDYGQKHTVEMKQRTIFRSLLTDQFPDLGARLGPDHVVALDLAGQIAGNIDSFDVSRSEMLLRKKYIPGRNLIMMSLSASVAFRRGIETLACGVSETEYSGYPDCRRQAMSAIEVALDQATGFSWAIQCPLMDLDKAGVWRLSHALGGGALLELIREETHTCYEGVREIRHPWGYGCARCDACRLREKGWREYAATSV
ncbi:7-cyano-7-deazaguanine synthase QueC [Tardiphaga sp. 619_E2_N8_5]|uniref:7-cyano-7-deazaguanine synthase QueC n=1 Tax=unclassified Tardiphaga TaxID=2631404 RepID=UPI003F1F5092